MMVGKFRLDFGQFLNFRGLLDMTLSRFFNELILGGLAGITLSFWLVLGVMIMVIILSDGQTSVYMFRIFLWNSFDDG